MADILRIQDQAKDRGFDSAEFFISAPNGVFKAKWLDSYFGFFNIEGTGEGFLMASKFPELDCFWEKADAEEHNKQYDCLRQMVADLAQ